MNLYELQKSIDYIRENYDNWSEIPMIAEIDLGEDRVLNVEINSVFIPDGEDVLVLKNEDLEAV
jgi:hypothetical protein